MAEQELTNEERRERLLEAAAAVLQHAHNRSLPITVLNKALFYLDLISLRDTGETLTRNTYVALDMGPVIAQYQKRLTRPLAKRGWAEQRTVGSARPVCLVVDEVPYSYLNDASLRRALQAARFAEQLTASGASELSHENLGWRVAYDAGRGGSGSPKPINMHLALQQLAELDDGDEDEWVEEDGLAQDEEAHLASRDSDDVVEWADP